LTVQPFTLQQRYEILYRFNGKPVPLSALDTRVYQSFGANSGAATQAAFERAA